MICPSKLCKAEIPEDSLYCDQCGLKILKCSKCGAIGISKFCGKCGGMMSLVIQLEPQEKSLQLCSSNGIILDVKDGSILGRTTGDFVQQLGTIPVISSRHAQISKKDGKWFITDLHSTNKTYVNNAQLTPDVPAEISENDVIILANVSFVARFK